MAGEVQLWESKVLYRNAYGGKVAIAPACCCEEESESESSAVGRCECEHLLNGGPYTYLVTFAGVVAKDPVDCADCDDWNQQHEVDCITPSCVWHSHGAGGAELEDSTYKATIPCQGAIEITATAVAGGVAFKVIAHENNWFGGAEFVKEFAGALPMDLDNPGVIPLDTTGNAACDWTNATCTVSS